MFLANYGDILTDADLSSLVGDFTARTATAGMLVVRPQQSFHMVDSDNGRVSGLRDARDADLWINGGYYMFRQGIFDVTRRGEELVDEPFARLIEAGQLVAYRHDGFHASLETLKDLERLQLLGDAGRLPSARRSVVSTAEPVLATAEMDLATAEMDLGEGDQLG